MHDLLRNGQAQSRAVFFAVTDEGMKHLVADRRVEPRTIIDDANFEMVVTVLHRDRDVPTRRLHRLARIQQQVVEDPFHLAGIAHRRCTPLEAIPTETFWNSGCA